MSKLNVTEVVAVFSQYNDFVVLYSKTAASDVASVRDAARRAVYAVRAALTVEQYRALYGLLEVSAPPNCQPARSVVLDDAIANRLSELRLIVRDSQQRVKVTGFGAHVAAHDLFIVR